MSSTIDATFDGRVFRPDEPVGLRPNTRVRISVEALPEEAPKSGSFLRTAQSLGLDGPPDWSENLDDYLYGSGSGE